MITGHAVMGGTGEEQVWGEGIWSTLRSAGEGGEAGG